MADLLTDISYLKGVGPSRAKLLKTELGVHTFGDLLTYLPFRYVDRSHVVTVDSVDPNAPYSVLRGRINDIRITPTSKYSERLTASFTDGTGIIDLVWFQGVKWIKESLKNDRPYLLMGKITMFGDRMQMAHPDIEPYVYSEQIQNHRFLPVYGTTEKLKAAGLNPKGISRLVDLLLMQLRNQIPETLPDYILSKYRLMGRESALRNMHFPYESSKLSQATYRMKFEELFWLQINYQYARYSRSRLSVGEVFSVVGHYFNTFYSECLPFQLTSAQKRVVKEIRNDMRSGFQMNRLLQGDVGSGKTLVALLSMLLAVDNGCQACMMAPTEILAVQHYNTIKKLLGDKLDLNVELLTGAMKMSQKRVLKSRLSNGDIHLLIGTHALIENDVVFQKLGLVVIDEQHRFGVEQRSKLWAKSVVPPHILVMTATPIPRTLSMTLYADLDCSVIDELPPGRQPIKTVHKTDSFRSLLFDFMRKQIAIGRQVYVVYPLINESETLDLKDLMDGYESMSRAFPSPQYQLSIVHGRQDPDIKAYEMERFKKGETHIMVSTTVIEVGVDVPNATVMVIENAERFGLSQLHQLRGRVGRGGGDSYCILMTSDKLSKTAQARIEIMCETTDGFRIAEADLKLRGPGDMQGTQQSGVLDLKLADLVDDEPLVVATRDEVRSILESDPELQLPQHYTLRKYLQSKRSKKSWDRII